MNGRKTLFPALLACALAFMLAACGGGAKQDDGGSKVDGGGSAPAEQPAEPSYPEGDWGSFVFDNADGAYRDYTDIGTASDLTKLMVDNFSSLEEFGATFLRAYEPEDSNGFVLIYRVNNPGFANEESVLDIIKGMKGSDIHSEYVVGNGSKIYFVDISQDPLVGYILFEIDGDSLLLTMIYLFDPSASDVLDRVGFVDGTMLSELVETGSGSGAPTGTQRIGSARNGWVDIPANWVVFNEAGGSEPEQIQYSDGSQSVISMFGIIPSEEGIDATGDEYASAFADVILENHNDNPDVEEAEILRQTLDCGLMSYIVDSTWTDGTTMFQFLIGGDGVCYYIAIEGDYQTAVDVAFMIIESFDPAK